MDEAITQAFQHWIERRVDDYTLRVHGKNWPAVLLYRWNASADPARE